MKFIAEIGSNIDGFDQACFAIEAAKDAGADIVKFQCFSDHDLYGGLSSTERKPIDPTMFSHLLKVCSANKVEFMCTAFAPEVYGMLDPFVSRHKIASAELTDTDILDTVNSFKKPVYLSTAGASYDDIRHALLRLRDCHVTIMYCVGEYPARIVNLNRIVYLKDMFGGGYEYGYSDHSTDVLIVPRMAVAMGCTVIEKHINPLDKISGPDVEHSLACWQFKLMVDNIRGALKVDEVENILNCDMKKKWRRRFVATKIIQVGETFEKGKNYEILRTKYDDCPKEDFVSTFRPWDLEGKQALHTIPNLSSICYSDIE